MTTSATTDSFSRFGLFQESSYVKIKRWDSALGEGRLAFTKVSLAKWEWGRVPRMWRDGCKFPWATSGMNNKIAAKRSVILRNTIKTTKLSVRKFDSISMELFRMKRQKIWSSDINSGRERTGANFHEPPRKRPKFPQALWKTMKLLVQKSCSLLLGYLRWATKPIVVLF